MAARTGTAEDSGDLHELDRNLSRIHVGRLVCVVLNGGGIEDAQLRERSGSWVAVELQDLEQKPADSNDCGLEIAKSDRNLRHLIPMPSIASPKFLADELPEPASSR